MTEEQRQNRLKVINLLRNKSQWPKDFTWNFKQTSPTCGCAIPLMRRVLGFFPYNLKSLGFLPYDLKSLGLTSDQFMDIFVTPGNTNRATIKDTRPWYNWDQWTKDFENTTPEDVAKKLEATL